MTTVATRGKLTSALAIANPPASVILAGLANAVPGTFEPPARTLAGSADAA